MERTLLLSEKFISKSKINIFGNSRESEFHLPFPGTPNGKFLRKRP